MKWDYDFVFLWGDLLLFMQITKVFSAQFTLYWRFASRLLPIILTPKTMLSSWMSVRSTGLLSQHYQTERDAVVGKIFLFNFSENIMSYSQNSMLCDLSAWSSINLQLCHHRTSMYSTSACDTTEQSVSQPEKKPHLSRK